MSSSKRKTGFVCHELYMWHNTGNYAGPMPYGNPVQPDTHAENPETKRRLRNLLEVAGLTRQLHTIDPREATEEEILRFHTPEHLARLKALSDGIGGDAGVFTPMGRGSYEIALLSAGGVLAALEAVLEGEVDNAYALVRPPGHHALADEGMGFCLFGNAALGGFHAFEKYGLERIAIVDWDVHHGNGTQHSFEEDDSIFYFSTHQYPFYPGTGSFEEAGKGKGKGFTLNVPLSTGYGDGEYLEIFEQILKPAALKFKPELILVSAGFDIYMDDPLGGMRVTPEGFAGLTRSMLDISSQCCDGKLVLTLEGGYNLQGLRDSVKEVLKEMAGLATFDKASVLARADQTMLDRVIKNVAQIHSGL